MDNPKDKPAQQKPDLSRRSLLKAAPLGALAVVAAGAARAETAPPAPAPEPEAAAGYRETEHIRRYYATAAYW
jgi:hypothetical protein